MLEKIPSSVGRALRRVRAGFDKLASKDPGLAAIPDCIALESPAFADGAAIPPRYTADGDRISPPLAWRGAPGEAEGLVLIIEDPDAPAPDPLVHLLAWDLPPDLQQLPEGEFKSPHHAGLDEMLGRNAYLQAAYLPPDPPAGHGRHLYVFQLFAVDRALSFDQPPSRRAVVEAMQGHVLGKGVLTGAYERL
jgi:Raf kinase inhibitor-like YbhB/YbcL family protein